MAARRNPLLRALIEAAITAGVALLLALPLVGFRTVQRQEGLVLERHLDTVLIAVGCVFIGRLVLVFFRESGLVPFAALQRVRAEKLPPASNALAALIVVALGLPFVVNQYVLEVAILVLLYIMLGWGLNIVVGLAGLLDLGYVAFYAVGAYGFALLAIHFGLTFWECLPIAGLLAAGFGLLLGFPVLRLRGDYLAIVTLGFGEIIRIVLRNWNDLTNGPNGLSGIPRPTFFGLPFGPGGQASPTFHEAFGLSYSPLHRLIFLYFIILGLAVLTNWFTMRIRKLPVGRAWEALREDEIACRSLGLNPTAIKLTAFAIGAMFGGFAGSFFATRQGFISPESFTFIESAIILAIVVLGGRGSQLGVVIASILLIGGPEMVRGLAEYRMLAFGALMTLITVWRPGGLISHREPTVRLAPAVRGSGGGGGG
jgi:branched-chain amino acid transport system permease protein